MSQYCKRLIEVDLPIKKISEQARRDKYPHPGNISSLHTWWARRPQSACRAVILASLLPDPADTQCPVEFRKKAIEVIRQVRGGNLGDPLVLRKALLDFIADFSAWEMSTNQVYLSIARELVQSAHIALGGEPGTRPLVVDPFAGGGSIPLEALRVGADAFAMDYNPVAVLILKVLLEYIPKYGHKLAEEVKKWGDWIKKEAERELSEFYPKDPDGSTPIAYIWARTIKCEGPGCGAEVPLMRSLWLAKKGKKSVALKMIPNRKEKRVDFEIIKGDLKEKDVQSGTVKRGSATCPVCGYTIPYANVREQIKIRKGGVDDVRLIVVVTINSNSLEKQYRLPVNNDTTVIKKLNNAIKEKYNFSRDILEGLNAPLSVTQRPYLWGMNSFGSLFTARQKTVLLVHIKYLQKAVNQMQKLINDTLLEKGICTLIAFSIDKLADNNSSLCRWVSSSENIANTFCRQRLAMLWDFGEINALRKSFIEPIVSIIESLSLISSGGKAEQSSALNLPLPDSIATSLITDPPYYDAIPYSDASDFFYIWLKQSVGELYPDLFKNNLTPKKDEIIVDPVKRENRLIKDKLFFEKNMSLAMQESKRILNKYGIGVVVFAHKSTAGWEAVLKAIVDAGWYITASWPIDTEMGSRMNAMNTAALASSIHLVCRPRPQDAGVGDWREVLSQLQPRIHEWMPRLSKEGIVGADAIFSCLGPALEIFSRYERVETASGKKVELQEYLEHVWSAVAREALNMIFAGADASGFEEDSRLTALWLWTLHSEQLPVVSGQNQLSVNSEQWSEEEELDTNHSPLVTKKLTGFFLDYDAVRKIAQGLGAHLEVLGGPGGIVEIKGDKARLVSVGERWKALFGKDKETRPRRKKRSEQATLFGDQWSVDSSQSEIEELQIGKTVLDRLHQAMLLFADGRSSALRRFIVDEGVGNDDRFWRLAQSLSVLYPAHTDEKRWINGVLARKKSFGF